MLYKFFIAIIFHDLRFKKMCLKFRYLYLNIERVKRKRNNFNKLREHLII